MKEKEMLTLLGILPGAYVYRGSLELLPSEQQSAEWQKVIPGPWPDSLPIACLLDFSSLLYIVVISIFIGATDVIIDVCTLVGAGLPVRRVLRRKLSGRQQL